MHIWLSAVLGQNPEAETGLSAADYTWFNIFLLILNMFYVLFPSPAVIAIEILFIIYIWSVTFFYCFPLLVDNKVYFEALFVEYFLVPYLENIEKWRYKSTILNWPQFYQLQIIHSIFAQNFLLLFWWSPTRKVESLWLGQFLQRT